MFLQNIVLIRDPEDAKKFYPRFNLEDTSSFKDLDDHRYLNFYILIWSWKRFILMPFLFSVDWIKSNLGFKSPTNIISLHWFSCATAKMFWKDYIMTIISIGKKIFGTTMLWRHCLSSWTHQICWLVEKILALFLLVFILYVYSTLFLPLSLFWAF